MLFCRCWTIKSTLGVAVLDVKINQCGTFSVTSGDCLTLDISLVRLETFSSTIFYLWFRWVFHTFGFLFRFKSKKIYNLPI